jgi:hypothetical protein
MTLYKHDFFFSFTHAKGDDNIVTKKSFRHNDLRNILMNPILKMIHLKYFSTFDYSA